MFRNLLLGGAGLLVTAALVFLMTESSAVDSEYYVDYGTKVNLLRQAETDFVSVSESLQAAYREGRAVPNSAIIAMGRVESARDQFGIALDSDSSSAIRSSYQQFDQALSKTRDDFDEFVTYQAELADATGIIRNDSPATVRDLRRFGLQGLSQSLFGLAVEVIDYASGSSNASKSSLEQKIDDLAADPAVSRSVPGKLDSFFAAARQVAAGREASNDALSRIETSSLPGSSSTLQATLRAENKAVVGKADRARTLLAVFSLLFLAGIAYTAIMLRRSYSALSDSKGELEQLNHSLEDRVHARTEQLTSAYDELKESQTQLVHAEKMSSLGELVAGISHEINTPLWYLISNATLLQERLGSFENFVGVTETLLNQLREGDKDKGKFVRRLQELDDILLNEALRDDLEESVDLIKDSIEGLEQLSEMAQSLKDFSRLDRAAVDRFNVNDGLEKSLLIGKNFLKNRIEVHKEFGDVPAITCAPGQINQIFLNLIKNASDAIEGKGEIYLTTREEGDVVVIEIKDNGPGIPEEVMAKIRDPFFTTKEVGKGTGLGLSIVDKIINSHLGELTIESEPGEGATFTVRLPINRESTDSAATDLEAEIDALNGDDGLPVAASA